jgi:capsule polysaccharide export protein KpsE/RkpR
VIVLFAVAALCFASGEIAMADERLHQAVKQLRDFRAGRKESDPQRGTATRGLA